MKSAVLIICVIAGVLAEPPRYRPARFRFQRIELVPTTTDSPTEATTDYAPYAPSGWKPSGEPFTLPNEKTAPDTYGAPEPQKSGPKTPLDTYGTPEPQKSGPYQPSGWKPDQPLTLPQKAPVTSYGVPDNTYGVPDNTYGAPSSDATTDKPQADKLDGSVDVQKSMGEYYVLLPNGQLQKIEFATENDIQNMKYTARLQLRNPAPIFVFGP